MKRDTKNILLGVVLGVLLFTVVSELSALSARKAAISDLNKEWASLKNGNDKIAAIIKADTIIANNQSAFSFFNSSADEGADEFAFYDGGDVWGWMDRLDGPEPEVETHYIIYNPESGQPFSGGEYNSYLEVRPGGGDGDR